MYSTNPLFPINVVYSKVIPFLYIQTQHHQLDQLLCLGLPLQQEGYGGLTPRACFTVGYTSLPECHSGWSSCRAASQDNELCFCSVHDQLLRLEVTASRGHYPDCPGTPLWTWGHCRFPSGKVKVRRGPRLPGYDPKPSYGELDCRGRPNKVTWLVDGRKPLRKMALACWEGLPRRSERSGSVLKILSDLRARRRSLLCPSVYILSTWDEGVTRPFSHVSER